jgi:hypothetical protein
MGSVGSISVVDTEKLTDWASSQASMIEAATRWIQGYDHEYWTTTTPQEEEALRAAAASGIAFLSTYTGPNSDWTTHATEALQRRGQTTAAQAREVAAILRQWAGQVASGFADVPRLAVAGRAAVASDDLMGQVHALIEDRDAHPAAAIVLAGAALELRTRAAVDARQITISERRSLGAYYRKLREDGLITAQTVKEFEAVAGLRNDAAHGQFDALSKERAGLMEQQVVLLLRVLDDLDPA